jgi:CBS domain-containing protein
MPMCAWPRTGRLMASAASLGGWAGAGLGASGRVTDMPGGGPCEQEVFLMAQKVSEIMTPAPVALWSGQPVTEAARVMRQHGIGNVLIVDDGELKGLVTDRDIVVRVVADIRDPAITPVGEICSPDLVTVAPDDDADTAVRRMREHAVRRVPVVENGHPVGVLSIGDMALERDERSALADISAQPPNT